LAAPKAAQAKVINPALDPPIPKAPKAAHMLIQFSNFLTKLDKGGSGITAKYRCGLVDGGDGSSYGGTLAPFGNPVIRERFSASPWKLRKMMLSENTTTKSIVFPSNLMKASCFK